MQNIQDVFNKIQEKRREQKNIKKMYRDVLEASHTYYDIVEKLKTLKEQKKKIESSVWEEVGTKDKYEVSKLDLKHEKELLTDIAISTLMKGETVKVVDEGDNEYEPKFSVSFKKTNVISQKP